MALIRFGVQKTVRVANSNKYTKEEIERIQCVSNYHSKFFAWYSNIFLFKIFLQLAEYERKNFKGQPFLFIRGGFELLTWLVLFFKTELFLVGLILFVFKINFNVYKIKTGNLETNFIWIINNCGCQDRGEK